ncbi:MAG: AmmeMemoRadiSam system protein B [Mariprofundaceae bacterium]|nr:AmmeMemoRadiSam system protein B [Mariprofundaceae bacterium]
MKAVHRMHTNSQQKRKIRPPAVAGLFYPASADELKLQLDALLSEAIADFHAKQTAMPAKAMIVPHAGYIYSGLTAAIAYSRLNSEHIRRVVLLGPVHRVPVRGLALPDADVFATPLGMIPLDSAGMQSIERLPQVVTSAAAHQQEHSLEVQLPFLQRVLRNFTLIPLAVGDATPDDVGEVLNALWGDESTLILISSDLSHFHPYAEAQRIDAATAENVLALESPINHQQACGATPINGLLSVAKARNMRASLLDLRNSGDTAGDHARVVGYGAFAFHDNAFHGGEFHGDEHE